MMNALQIYVVFGLPMIALLAAAVALVFVKRSAAGVDRADLAVQKSISARREYFDNLNLEAVNGLEGKVEIASPKVVTIKQVG